MEEELVMHALVRCGHASVLRNAMREIWDLPDELKLLNMTPDSLLPMVVEAGIDQGSKLLLLLWRTWYVRNKITHSSDKPSFAASVSDNRVASGILMARNQLLFLYVQENKGRRGSRQPGNLRHTAGLK
jgi:hypothetical protein